MAENLISLPEGYTKTPESDIMPPLHLLTEDNGSSTEYKIWGTPIEGLLVWERKSMMISGDHIKNLVKLMRLQKY